MPNKKHHYYFYKKKILRTIEKTHSSAFWLIAPGFAVLFSVICISASSAQTADFTNELASTDLYVNSASTTVGSNKHLNILDESEIERETQIDGKPSIESVELSINQIPQISNVTQVDPVTLIAEIDTSQFFTPNDPTDDSIEYTPGTDFTGTDSFMYQICDATGDCDQAEVTVNVTSGSEAQGIVEVTNELLSTNLALGTPTAANDNTSVVQNGWVNIDVLKNDDFGPDGPSSSAITIYSPPTSGTANVTVNEGPRSPDPSGLAFLSTTNQLLFSDGEVNEIMPPNPAAYTGTNLFITSLLGSIESTLTTYNPPGIEISNEPTGVAFNADNGFLYFTDDTGQKGVFELDPGSDGLFNTPDDAITFFGSVGNDPEGIAYDSIRGHLLVIDGMSHEVYDIDLGPNGVLDPLDAVTQFDVGPKTSVNLQDPEGIEFNPDNNHLFILDSSGQKYIAETMIDGTFIRYLDISTINPDNPAGLALAPASSGGPGKNLYIVDRGVDNNPPGGDPLENDGKMYEVSFEDNAPPFVDAGEDQLIVFGESANLDGIVLDDGKPDPPATISLLWSKTNGPGEVIFTDPNLEDTTASFSASGIYNLRLTADDTAESNYDEVTITVSPLANQPPQVEAGSFQVVYLPGNAILDGTVIDDGLGIPPGTLITTWGKTSGPGSVTFANASWEDTTASFSEPGQYVLHLDADDGEYSASDQVTISVNTTSQVIIWLPLIRGN